MSESSIKEKYIPRFLKSYREKCIPQMRKEKGYENDLVVPKIVKIAMNMGIGEATSDSKIIEKAVNELSMIVGQKAKVCRARKDISNFKLRKGTAIGCCVTLRKNMMYEFLDRLITIAVPRIRDFRGFSPNSFDGKGNYTFGLLEQSIFPELDIDNIGKTQGMNISIHTSAKTDQEARGLLDFFGFPFRR